MCMEKSETIWRVHGSQNSLEENQASFKINGTEKKK